MKVYILLKWFCIDFDYGEEVLSLHDSLEKAKRASGSSAKWIKEDGEYHGENRIGNLFIIKTKNLN